MPKKKLFLSVNCHGPKGALVLAGEPVPTDWPDELVDALSASGGTTTEER